MSLQRTPQSRVANRRLLLWLSDDARDQVRTALGSTVGVFCETYRDAIAAAKGGAIDAIVWELSGVARHAEPLQSTVGDLAKSVPILLRTDLTSTNVRQIIALSATACDLRISLSTGGDDLIDDIRALLVNQERSSAEHAIITRLMPNIVSLGPEIVVGATVLARRRRRVSELASVIGRSERTLEWRLRSAHAPGPRAVLGWILSLHSVWRLEIAAWPLKRAAHTAGFKDASALSNYMNEHLGVRASSALRMGFWDCLEHFASQLPL